jgi:hypothetical protein
MSFGGKNLDKEINTKRKIGPYSLAYQKKLRSKSRE